MSEDAITSDVALDLILLVRFARTLADLNVVGYWLWAHCSQHGDRQEAVFGPDLPASPSIGCRACYHVGVKRELVVEDIHEF